MLITVFKNRLGALGMLESIPVLLAGLWKWPCKVRYWHSVTIVAYEYAHGSFWLAFPCGIVSNVRRPAGGCQHPHWTSGKMMPVAYQEWKLPRLRGKAPSRPSNCPHELAEKQLRQQGTHGSHELAENLRLTHHSQKQMAIPERVRVGIHPTQTNAKQLYKTMQTKVKQSADTKSTNTKQEQIRTCLTWSSTDHVETKQ